MGIIYAQSKEQLEAERMVIIKQIEATSQVLNKTKANKELALQQYNALQNQIESRNYLLKNIEGFIDKMDEDVLKNRSALDSLERNLFLLNNNFAVLANIHLKKKIIQKPWMYLLSANSLKEAFVKWRLIKQYEKHFQHQKEFITSLNQSISQKIGDIEEELAKKKLILELEQDQKKLLQLEQKKKNNTLSNLDQSARKLQRSLDQQRIDRENLNKEIESYILKELSLFDKNNLTHKHVATDAVSTNINESNTVTSINLGLDFPNKKGSLTWPVEGKIVSFFGKQNHPEIEQLQIQNNGINIRTQNGAMARCIHDGNVVSISFVPGHQNLIIIKHGNYFSVYSNIDIPSVRQGQAIYRNDPIGTIHTDKNFNTELHLEIWNGKIKENPSLWLKR